MLLMPKGEKLKISAQAFYSLEAVSAALDLQMPPGLDLLIGGIFWTLAATAAEYLEGAEL